MPKVESTPTRYTSSVLAEELVGAFVSKFGVQPSQNLASLLWALICVETGNGQFLTQNNVGFVTVSDDSQNYFLRGKNPLHFRAYGTLAEGLENFLHEIVTRRPSMVRAAESGDARAFAQAYRDTRYNPAADVEEAEKNFRSVADRGLSSGFFITLPKHTSALNLPGGSSPSSPQSTSRAGSGAALLIIAAATGIFVATNKIKPGKKALP